MKLQTVELNIYEELRSHFQYEGLSNSIKETYDDYMILSFKPMTDDGVLDNVTITVSVYDSNNIGVGMNVNNHVDFIYTDTTYNQYMDIVNNYYDFIGEWGLGIIKSKETSNASLFLCLFAGGYDQGNCLSILNILNIVHNAILIK